MKRWRNPAIHMALWLVYLLTYASLWRPTGMDFSQSLIRELFLLPVKLLLVYTCILFLVPYYLKNKRYVAFTLLTLLLVLIAGIIHNTYWHMLVPPAISLVDPSEALFDIEKISKRMTYVNSPMLFALTLVMVHNWYEQKEQNAKIVEENLNARLQLLKQQFQPHFLFNTLNNIYSLALQKSERTPLMILKLSELIRYLACQHDYEWQPLSNELSFLKNYVSLENMRYEDKVEVRWNVRIAAPDLLTVPPMVLATFAENAFKHGVSDTIKSASVYLDLSEDDEFIVYTVRNTKVPVSTDTVPVIPSGTGLLNLRRRLELLYGASFRMELIDEEETYTAKLILSKRCEKSIDKQLFSRIKTVLRPVLQPSGGLTQTKTHEVA